MTSQTAQDLPTPETPIAARTPATPDARSVQNASGLPHLVLRRTKRVSRVAASKGCGRRQPSPRSTRAKPLHADRVVQRDFGETLGQPERLLGEPATRRYRVCWLELNVSRPQLVLAGNFTSPVPVGASGRRGTDVAVSYLITSSARPKSETGTVRPSALAVLTLMISSSFQASADGLPKSRIGGR